MFPLDFLSSSSMCDCQKGTVLQSYIGWEMQAFLSGFFWFVFIFLFKYMKHLLNSIIMYIIQILGTTWNSNIFKSHKKELTVIKEQMKAVISSSYAEMNCSNLVPSCQGIFSLKETRYLQWLFKNVIFWTHSYTKSMSILYSNRFPSFYFGTRWYTRHRLLCFPLRRFYNFMSW